MLGQRLATLGLPSFAGAFEGVTIACLAYLSTSLMTAKWRWLCGAGAFQVSSDKYFTRHRYYTDSC